MSRIRSSLLFAAPLTLLAACGGGSSTPAETLPADVDLLVKAVPSLKFDKTDYGTVKAGEIMFGYSNEDSVRHTLILAKDDQKVPNFKLVIGEKGDNDSGAVALEPGKYVLICDVPGHSNMKATLTVE